MNVLKSVHMNLVMMLYKHRIQNDLVCVMKIEFSVNKTITYIYDIYMIIVKNNLLKILQQH